MGDWIQNGALSNNINYVRSSRGHGRGRGRSRGRDSSSGSSSIVFQLGSQSFVVPSSPPLTRYGTPRREVFGVWNVSLAYYMYINPHVYYT